MKSLLPFLLILILSLTACAAPTPGPIVFSEPGPPKATAVLITEPVSKAMARPTETEIPPVIDAAVGSIPDASLAHWTVVSQGLRAPLGIETAGDKRMFILERHGLIWIFDDGSLLSEPFLDLSDRVSTQGSEQGLLGLAFHPDYRNNGTFFVNYTDIHGDTVIARFQLSSDPNRADPLSATAVLQIPQPFRNHNGGDLVFGPDGYLYIATGDGGSGGDPQGNAQNLNTLLGKILRIDVNSGDPYDTPVDNISTGLSEIWAYGLRNPWRIHFDGASGDLFIADVGQNQWEEVNFQPVGAQAGWNFGWGLREGAHIFKDGDTSGLIDPVVEYSHQLGISVTGGVVVRDPRLPEWEGVYLYGDFGSGIVWGLLKQLDGGWSSTQLWDTGASISAFGQDHESRVYMVDYSGKILRLDPTQ